MTCWDTSAIVPLLVAEPGSNAVQALVRADLDMIVWWGTLVELTSALERRRREGMERKTLDAAEGRLARLARSWVQVDCSDAIREDACRLLRIHVLRAGDALQLAAARAWADGRPSGHRFATFDGRLAEAARAEGFLNVVAAT